MSTNPFDFAFDPTVLPPPQCPPSPIASRQPTSIVQTMHPCSPLAANWNSPQTTRVSSTSTDAVVDGSNTNGSTPALGLQEYTDATRFVPPGQPSQKVGILSQVSGATATDHLSPLPKWERPTVECSPTRKERSLQELFVEWLSQATVREPETYGYWNLPKTEIERSDSATDIPKEDGDVAMKNSDSSTHEEATRDTIEPEQSRNEEQAKAKQNEPQCSVELLSTTNCLDMDYRLNRSDMDYRLNRFETPKSMDRSENLTTSSKAGPEPADGKREVKELVMTPVSDAEDGELSGLDDDMDVVIYEPKSKNAASEHLRENGKQKTRSSFWDANRGFSLGGLVSDSMREPDRDPSPPPAPLSKQQSRRRKRKANKAKQKMLIDTAQLVFGIKAKGFDVEAIETNPLLEHVRDTVEDAYEKSANQEGKPEPVSFEDMVNTVLAKAKQAQKQVNETNRQILEQRIRAAEAKHIAAQKAQEKPPFRVVSTLDTFNAQCAKLQIEATLREQAKSRLVDISDDDTSEFASAQAIPSVIGRKTNNKQNLSNRVSTAAAAGNSFAKENVVPSARRSRWDIAAAVTRSTVPSQFASSSSLLALRTPPPILSPQLIKSVSLAASSNIAPMPGSYALSPSAGLSPAASRTATLSATSPFAAKNSPLASKNSPLAAKSPLAMVNRVQMPQTPFNSPVFGRAALQNTPPPNIRVPPPPLFFNTPPPAPQVVRSNGTSVAFGQPPSFVPPRPVPPPSLFPLGIFSSSTLHPTAPTPFAHLSLPKQTSDKNSTKHFK